MDVRASYHQSKQAVTLYAEWPMRIVFASIFLFKGITKFTGDPQVFADGVGISYGMAVTVALLECIAGAFVFLGGFTFPAHAWFTRIGAVAAFPALTGAISKYHWPQWGFEPSANHPLGGMEFQVTLILVALYLLASTGRLREHMPTTRVAKDADGDAKARAVAANFPVHAHWFLRIALASVFLYHGFTKFGTLDEFSAMMGLSVAFSFLVAFVECTAGILVLVGGARTDFADGASRLGGLLLIPVMLGAIYKVHAPRWDFGATDAFPLGGAEFQTLLITIGLFFVLRGRPATGPIAAPQAAGA